MMHTKRWIGALAATAVAAGVLLAGGGTAFADAGCKGSTCIGQDPNNFGCAPDAVTQYTLATSVGTLERRYSHTCDASWARITNSSAGTWFYVQNCYNSDRQTYNVPAGYDNAFTNMIPGGGSGIRVGDDADHGPC